MPKSARIWPVLRFGGPAVHCATMPTNGHLWPNMGVWRHPGQSATTATATTATTTTTTTGRPRPRRVWHVCVCVRTHARGRMSTSPEIFRKADFGKRKICGKSDPPATRKKTCFWRDSGGIQRGKAEKRKSIFRPPPPPSTTTDKPPTRPYETTLNRPRPSRRRRQRLGENFRARISVWGKILVPKIFAKSPPVGLTYLATLNYV